MTWLRPWLMAQSWHDLLFAHWPVSLDQLRRVVPPQLTIDTFDDQAWLGVVAFRIENIRLRGLPALPGVAKFPEVNLRTYVRLNDQPGVLFLSLHCPNRLAMAIARPWFRLPYRNFTVAANGTAYCCQIAHAPWPLAPGEAEVTANTLARPLQLDLPQVPPLLHYAERTDALIWPLVVVSNGRRKLAPGWSCCVRSLAE